ncbi:DUF262 domain-containing protein [Desulfurobacterium sp.]
MSQITLKTIYEILGEKFIIPYYQRGYRWTKSQVEQLLKDLWEFSDKNENKNEFYCLQPIVVKKTEKGWELIDGQQRLTTIYIILKVIEEIHLKRSISEAFGRELFYLDYQVRKNFDEILNGKLCNGESVKEKNIDFYYICNAYDTIKSWFKSNQFNFNKYNKFLSTLLAEEDKDHPVKVIWYEVEGDADGVEIFTRLNMGKIPLTNAELIKALFLNRSNFPDAAQEQIRLKQLQIAAEWDEIEHTLQKDEFWFFIFDKSNKKFYNRNYDTRIEYIFDLMKKRPKDAEDYFTFYEFHKDLKSKDIDSLWKEIKGFFYTLKEWYEDDEFYHLIGYLVAIGKDILSIKDEYKKKAKSEFKKYLKEEIYKTISNDTSNIDNALEKIKELEYGNGDVKNVLLLFNILILLNNKGANIRFPFDRYKKEKWDIEHVFSQTDLEFKLKEYVKLILEFWTGEKVEMERLDENAIKKLEQKLDESVDIELFRNLVKVYNENKDAKKLFDKIKEKLINAFQEEKIENRDNISNLVLLDAGTNRAYKNAFFPIKRAIILEKIKRGSFVPIGTQNVFLKAYSKRFDNIMFWTKEDAEGYLNAIVETFKAFFNQRGDENEQ